MVFLLIRLLAFPLSHYLYFYWVPRDDVVLWSLLTVVYGFFSLAILKPLSAATIKPLAGVFWRCEFSLSSNSSDTHASLTANIYQSNSAAMLSSCKTRSRI